jgi:hypothetical protein
MPTPQHVDQVRLIDFTDAEPQIGMGFNSAAGAPPKVLSGHQSWSGRAAKWKWEQETHATSRYA